MTAAQRAFEVSDYETAVSRAYYAAYHALIVMFERRIGVTRPRWSHNFLPYFGRFPELDDHRQSISYLYEMRSKADYENTVFGSAEVSVVISAAERIRRAAEEDTYG